MVYSRPDYVNTIHETGITILHLKCCMCDYDEKLSIYVQSWMTISQLNLNDTCVVGITI